MSAPADVCSADRTASQVLAVCNTLHCGRARSPLALEKQMLETIAVVLVILWLLGMVSSYTLGGFIHILLVIAVIVVIVRIIRGRDPL
jgi:Family of unknown function (DUF5670)